MMSCHGFFGTPTGSGVSFPLGTVLGLLHLLPSTGHRSGLFSRDRWRPGRRAILHPRPNNLSNAPGLPRAAVGPLRRVAVIDLGDAAQAVFDEHLHRTGKRGSSTFDIAVDKDERGGIGTEEPGPCRSLMVRRIHFRQGALVSRFVAFLSSLD